MQVVILAAGRGTRMKNLTNETPKPMLKIKDKPILEYKLNNLPEEVSEVIFVVGYKRGQIEKHFGSVFGGRKIIKTNSWQPVGRPEDLVMAERFLEKIIK